MKENISPGLYKHYKGKKYIVIGIARHSESLEKMVVYEGQYRSEEFGNKPLWVRPLSLFQETVKSNGKEMLRFKKI